MCDVTRREFLAGSAAAFAALGNAQADQGGAALPRAPDPVATDVYFYLDEEGCNNGWVVFRDYVLVIDANYPATARDIVPKVRALTDRPIRFAFDTHHHGDHVYGNQVLVDNGATPVSHTGVLEELKRYETGYYGGKPGRWEGAAKQRADLKDTRLNPPSVLFPRELYFDDGRHRVELVHLGVAHTHGDAFAWLPNERILFTGDACVNGPYNFVGDGNVEQWIKTLDAAKKLGARFICPGHGGRGEATLLDDQQEYFKRLWERVGALVLAKKGPDAVRETMDGIAADLGGVAQIARYVSKENTRAHVQKVYEELTGTPLAPESAAKRDARLQHAQAHGLPLVERLARA